YDAALARHARHGRQQQHEPDPAHRCRAITRHTSLALFAGALLLLSLAWPHLAPGSATLAQVLAAVASLVVAPPVFAGAWRSLRTPSLHTA
ncbi:hypothetical protein AB3X91_05835, partial [Paraburkholderia sp. BR14263]|uniref:hypothetical protein n=1 Tax=Paraburkholderia sp. BR14263 TaxID=3237000 RepID=UPI0034CD75C1